MSITQALREMAEELQEARKQATEHEGPSGDLTKEARHKKANDLIEQFLIQETNDNGPFPSIDPTRVGGSFTFDKWLRLLKLNLNDAVQSINNNNEEDFAYIIEKINQSLIIAKTLQQKQQ